MKTALVTGGSRGIGLAIANRLAADGYRVAVSYRTTPPPENALFLQKSNGFFQKSDVSDPVSTVQLVDIVLEKFCQLDILVCNAGVSWQGLTQDMGVEEYRRVMGTDLDGVFYCCQAVLPHMIARKTGKIITISSMWGQVGGSCEAAYSAAKAGVIGLTKALAKEVGPSGVTVNCVAPGVIDTDMNRCLAFLGPEGTAGSPERQGPQGFAAGSNGSEAAGGPDGFSANPESHVPQGLQALAEETPLGRMGTAEEVAGVVSFLCSPAANFLTGQVIAPNGGLII